VFLFWWFLGFRGSEGFKGEGENEGEELVPPFPKKIWSYWEGDMSLLVKNCVKTWSKFNPEYEIVILNRENLSEYLPEEDLLEKPWADYNYTPQRFSDMVRLHILCQEGGFWMDATIILQESLEWVQAIRANTGCEFFAYYLDKFANDKWRDASPVIEGWFFACTPGCEFVRDWRDEFRTIVDYNTIWEYVDEARETTDLQNIVYPDYLAIHVSAQKLLQKDADPDADAGERKTDEYGMVLMSAEDVPYAYLRDNNWNSREAVKELVRGSYADKALIKLRGLERPSMETNKNMEQYFSRLFTGGE
jgi:hypothetical protein